MLRFRSTATVSSEFKSPEADISSCLSSLRAAAAHIDSGVVDTGKNRVSQLSYHPFYSTDLKVSFVCLCVREKRAALGFEVKVKGHHIDDSACV